MPARQRGLVIVGVAVAIITLLAVQAGPGRDDPTGFSARGDAGRTGVVSRTDVPAPTQIAWRTELSGNGGWNDQRVALASEHVVVSSLEGVSLHARDSGVLRWHRPDLHTTSPAAVFDDVVVVFDLREPTWGTIPPNRAAAEGRIVALDATDGATRWSAPTDFGLPRLAAHPAGLVVIDRTRTATLFEPSTGEVVWSFDGLERASASLRDILVGDDPEAVHLMVTRPAGIDPDEAPPELVSEHLVAVDAETGEVSFEVAAERETIAPRPLAVIGDVVAGVDARQLWIWDATDGELLTTTTHALPRAVVGVTGVGDTAVVIDESGVLAAFDVPSGSRLWSQRISEARIGGLTAAGDSLLVPVGDRIAVLNLRTGQLRRNFDLPEGAFRSPADPSGEFAVVTDGRVTVHEPGTSVLASFLTVVVPWPEPIARDGRVAVATAGEVAYLDAGSGDPIWRMPISSESTDVAPRTVHAPALAEEVLVHSPPHAGRGDPEEGLIGVDLTQSLLLWDRTGDGLPPTGPSTLVGDTVFLPVGDEIHGHDVTTGRRVFAARARHPRGAIAVHEEYVIAASDPEALARDGTRTASLVAIRRLDRSLAWDQPLETCAAPTVIGDRVLAVTPEGISAHDVHRGEREWLATLEPSGCLDLAVAGGTAVAVEGRHALVALDVGSGEVRWRVDLGDGVAAPPTIAGDTVLVPLLDGRVTGLALVAGDTRWSFDLGTTAASPVAVAAERYLVVTRDGELVAFGP